MKTRNSLLTFAAFIATFFFSTNALFGQLTIDGQYRARGEVRHGWKKLPTEATDPAGFVTQRARLGLNYQTDLYHFRFSFQDVRTWGQDDIYSPGGVWGDTHSLGVYEAFVDLNLNKSHIKLGRQELKYENGRLFIHRDWYSTGMTYDAAKFYYKDDNWQFDIVASYNSKGENLFDNDYYDDSNRMKVMGMGYLKHSFSPAFYSSLTAVTAGYQDAEEADETHYMNTIGLNLVYQKEGLKLRGEGYYQGGLNPKGQKKKAYLLAGRADYQANKTWNFGLGLDYFSGHDAFDEDADYQATDHGFHLMYGARFPFYGNLVQFTFVGKPIDQAGLANLSARVGVKPHPKGKLILDYHYFAMTADQIDPAQPEKALDKGLGSEIDLYYVHKFRKDISLKTGFAYMFPSKSMEVLKGVGVGNSTDTYMGYLQLLITPRLYSSKK